MKKVSFSTAIAAMLLTLPTGAMTLAPVLLTPTAAHAKDNVNVGQLLKSLRTVNVEEFDVYTDFTAILDVRFVLEENQINALANAIQGNPIVRANSVALTSLLQEVGIVTESQRVVGYINGTIYVQQF